MTKEKRQKGKQGKRGGQIKVESSVSDELICGYPREIYEEIFDTLATTEKGIKRICESDDRFPNHASVYRAVVRCEAIGDSYARAREAQFNVLTDVMRQEIDEADITDRVEIDRLKLKVQNLHWMASKLSRKKYGDRVSVDIDVDTTIKQFCANLNLPEVDFRRVSEKIDAGRLDFGETKLIKTNSGEEDNDQ